MAKKNKKKKKPVKFTVIAKLNPACNAGILEAFDAEVHPFNTAKILTFHHIRKLAMAGRTFDSPEQSSWNTWLQKEFHVLKRTANSIIYEARTLWEMHKEAEIASLEADEKKLESLTEEIKELEETKKENAEFLTGKKPLEKKKNETEEAYRKRSQETFEKTAARQKALRSRLVSKKKQMDRLKARIQKKRQIIKTGNYRICFGTKKHQKTNTEVFRAHRDSQISFTGSADETAGNEIFQLFWGRGRNQYEIRMRKDFYEKPEIYEEKVIRHREKNGKPAWTETKKVKKKEPVETAWIKGRVHFGYGSQKIRQALKNGQPLSYRIIKKGKDYYLYCMFDWKPEEGKAPSLRPLRHEEDSVVLQSANELYEKKPAMIGCDINKGFVSVSIANTTGGLIKTFDLNYRFGQGDKTVSDLGFIISRIVCLAYILNVPVSIEDINLSAKKYRSRRKGNRALNRMLHSFAYRTYIKMMECCCLRYGVKLIKVNPAWTSEIARRKFCTAMKLCVHNGAAWVIARRGMGIWDRLPKALKKKDMAKLYQKKRQLQPQ